MPSRNTVLRLLPLILLPFLLTAIDDSWTFLAPHGDIDSYVYTGFFLDLQNHVRTFAQTYYSSRLPWILVGSLAYTLAPVDLANLLLRFFLFYTATFSLYFAVRTIWNNHSAALLSAILLGVHTHFLYSIHWDYVDGPASTALLASFAFLASSTRATRPIPLLMASSFAAAVAVSIHIFAVFLLPALGLWYAWTHADTSRGRFWRGVVFLGSGAILAFLLFGSINWTMGSDFNYLQPQINVARTVNTSPWRQSDRQWIEFATWLAFPTMAVLFSVAVVTLAAWKRGRGHRVFEPDSRMLILAGLVMLLSYATFVLIELRRGLALQQDYYASFLFPYTFVVLGGGISVSMSRLARLRRLNMTIVPLSLILLVGSFVVASFRSLPGCTPTCSLFGPMGLVALGGAAGIGLSIASRHAAVLILTIASMAVVNAAPQQYFPTRDLRNAMHDRFMMVHDANAALQPYNRDGELRFWYSRDEPLGLTFVGIASLHLWGFRLISDSFPKLTDPQSGTDAPVAGRTVALLTRDDDALSKADETLTSKGLRAILLYHDRIRRHDEAFNLFVMRAVPSGPRLELRPLKFEPVAGKVVSSKDDSIRIVGAAVPWAYAAILHLPRQPKELDGASPIYLHLRLTVNGETVGVGVLTDDGRAFVDYQEVDPTGVPKNIHLRLPSLDAEHDLVIRTVSHPRASDVQVESVSLSGANVD